MAKPLLLLPAVLLLGSTASLTPAFSQAGKTANEVSPRIKEIYKIDCALCHGEKGDGKTDLAQGMGLTLADFSDPKTLDGKTDDELFNVIRKGKDKMPGEEANRAKDAEVHGLIVYLRSLSKGQPVPAAAPVPAATASSNPGAR